MPEPYSLTPVDHDPFEPMAPDKIVPADSFADRFKLTPVDHDPFEPQVTNPIEFATPQQPAEYPSSEEAQFARDAGFDYGKPYESYSKGERFRNAPPMAGLTDVKSADMYAPFLFDTPETAVPPQMQKEVADVYEKSALVANRSPVTALGYDPSHFAVEFGNREGQLGGFYQPEANQGWANAHYYYSLVHESTHRGLAELKQSDLLSPQAKEFLSNKANDELVVRHLMQKYAGVKVPPGTQTTESDQLEQKAAALASDETWSQQIAEIEAAASQLMAKKRPGGPR